MLNLPYALKNRFAFAAMRMSDEANRICPNVAVELPATTDDSAAPKWNLLWAYVSLWKSCEGVRNSVDKITPAGRSRIGRIEAYRDRYVHRIPCYIGLGILESTAVEWNHRGWSATTSNSAPLDLIEIVKDLVPAHDACRKAHIELDGLANEHWQQLKLLTPRE